MSFLRYVIQPTEITPITFRMSHFLFRRTLPYFIYGFGIGVSDDNGLTFCSKYCEPVVINTPSNKPRLIQIIENDISNEVSWNDDFGYLELMANDGAYDNIIKTEQSENGIILTIKREFQEGWNEYVVKINLSKRPYEAEYLSYGEIKY